MWALRAIGATPSAAYSAANAGLHAMVRNRAIKLAPYRIRVNAVAPAVVKTPVYNSFVSDNEVRDTLSTFNAFHHLGRKGQRVVFAEAILLLRPCASWIRGAALPVDGAASWRVASDRSKTKGDVHDRLNRLKS